MQTKTTSQAKKYTFEGFTGTNAEFLASLNAKGFTNSVKSVLWNNWDLNKVGVK